MGKIYILHAGAKLFEDGIKQSKYCKNITLVNPRMNSKVLRVLRKVHCNTSLKSKRIWIDTILNNFNIEDNVKNTIIIFDAPIWILNISYIRERYKNIKIIFWFWNIIKNEKQLLVIKENVNEVFIFDEKQADKYKLKYHPQFYWLKNIPKQEIENDLFFVGRNKNRLDLLERIFIKCNKQNMKCKFHIVQDSKNNKSDYIELHKEGLNYDEVLNQISKSKCILDLNQKGQAGLTLRALEALFFEKKLITNNIDLINYDFYDSGNICILDEKLNIEYSFINSSYLKVNKNIKSKYYVDSWLEKLTK